jgi:hypothetical protein
MTLREIFKYGRVAGIAGNRHQGKTNNIVAMILDFRKTNKSTEIYAYGLPPDVCEYLAQYNVKTIDTLKQLSTKKNSIIILDEFQKLGLGDRRKKELLQDIMAMIYHPTSNNYILFCSPTTREYNSVIGGYIEVWLLKAMHLSDTINGSQLKETLKDYKGKYYKLGYFDIPKDKMILINDKQERVLDLPFIKDVDTKSKNVDVLAYEKIVKEKVRKKVQENVSKIVN